MKKFTDLTLKPLLMQAINDLKFEKPTSIQSQALPILLGKPTDFIGLAATGTGKTAAFSIPMLERIDTSQRHLQALVLCPTRELALQVCNQISLLGKHLKVKTLPVYGGAGFGEQLKGLKEGVHVVVGTPGRVVDHLNRKTLKLSQLTTLILDEADEMISMGFKESLEAILEACPREHSKIWLFSATMSKEVRKVADTYLHQPEQVQINRQEMLPSTVEQIYYPVMESQKPEVLCKLIDVAENFYGLIFCQTKSLVADITQFLLDSGYKADCLHGDKDQNSRERTMQAFRNRRVSILVCTDVASRGLDVKDLTHVINYSIPRELDSYVHRIGRTARSGKSGLAMSLVTPANRSLIPRIEKMTNSRMVQGKVPSRREIAERKVNEVLTQFKEQKNFKRAIEVMGESWKSEILEMSKEEIVGRFLYLRLTAEFTVPDTNSAPTHNVKPQREESHRGNRGGKPFHRGKASSGKTNSNSRGYNSNSYGGSRGTKKTASKSGEASYSAKSKART